MRDFRKEQKRFHNGYNELEKITNSEIRCSLFQNKVAQPTICETLFNKIAVSIAAILVLANVGTAVQAQPSADIVSAEGQVVPQEQVALAFQTGGTVESVFVADGDQVQAGDPLLQLDPAAAELGLA